MYLDKILKVDRIPEIIRPININLECNEDIVPLDINGMSPTSINSFVINILLQVLNKTKTTHELNKMFIDFTSGFKESIFNTRNGYATLGSNGRINSGKASFKIVADYFSQNWKKDFLDLHPEYDGECDDKTLRSIMETFIFSSRTKRGISIDTVNDLITFIGCEDLKKYTTEIQSKYLNDFMLTKYKTISINDLSVLLTPESWRLDSNVIPKIYAIKYPTITIKYFCIKIAKKIKQLEPEFYVRNVTFIINRIKNIDFQNLSGSIDEKNNFILTKIGKTGKRRQMVEKHEITSILKELIESD